MAGPATILREIHRLRRHAKDLQAEIDRGPRLLKAQRTKVAKQEEALQGGHDTLKRLKMSSHDKEVQLKATLQQINKHENQLNEAGSKKEYDALKTEIAADKKKCQELEDEILGHMAEIEERTAQLPALEKAVQHAKAEYAEHEKNAQGRIAGLTEQLNKALADIQQIESTLPSDIRPQYDRLVAARGEDAMAAVEHRTCMACYTEITAQSYNDLMLSQFVFCKNCGRALYLPD
ncbi:MAG TPA: C4-type zinc ribbon domain-containing protein [Gemmataceae bacterium]|nr:C4-type zinc ribbon domain-containing protein [Gemmataceae bacterium]